MDKNKARAEDLKWAIDELREFYPKEEDWLPVFTVFKEIAQIPDGPEIALIIIEHLQEQFLSTFDD